MSMAAPSWSSRRRRGTGPGTAVRVAADVPARRGLLRARAVALHHRDVPVALALRLSERLQRRLLQRDPLERLQRRRLGARIGGMNERIVAPREPDDAGRCDDGHDDPGHDGPAADARANGMPSHEGSDPTDTLPTARRTPPGCHRIAIPGRGRCWSRCQCRVVCSASHVRLGGVDLLQLAHMRVGVRELRQRASELLRSVEAGETIEITDRGRPVAVLAPAGPRSDSSGSSLRQTSPATRDIGTSRHRCTPTPRARATFIGPGAARRDERCRATYLDSSALVKLVLASPSRPPSKYVRRRRTLMSSALARTEVARAVMSEGPQAIQRGREVLGSLELLRINDQVLESAGRDAGRAAIARCHPHRDRPTDQA